MDLEPNETYDASGDDHEEIVGALHFFAQEHADEAWKVTLVVDGDEIAGELVDVRDGVVILAVGGDPHEEYRYGDIESVRVEPAA